MTHSYASLRCCGFGILLLSVVTVVIVSWLIVSDCCSRQRLYYVHNSSRLLTGVDEYLLRTIIVVAGLLTALGLSGAYIAETYLGSKLDYTIIYNYCVNSGAVLI